MPRRLMLAIPGLPKLPIANWSFIPRTFALTLDMSSDTVDTPLRSISWRVMTCTGNAVSTSGRGMCDPVTWILSVPCGASASSAAQTAAGASASAEAMATNFSVRATSSIDLPSVDGLTVRARVRSGIGSRQGACEESNGNGAAMLRLRRLRCPKV
jgi:hypothetical protein